MDFFDRQWTSYRAIVEHDLMEHQAVAGATAAAIESWLAARPQGAAKPHMVDLGCGDLALLAPLLQRLPLASYTGLDLSAAVLPLAQRALGDVAYPSRWIEGDLLAWATEATDNAPVDILHSAFAIHHLTGAQKATFLQAARQRIAPGGLFIWVDVFCQPGEARESYIARYLQRIATGWHQLTAEQQEHVSNHLAAYDMPADRAAIAVTAVSAGWHWRWGWQGAHQAEALAVLTPA
ncbi:MAG: class I SAM-dependent methyltransferase [Cyanobacteriota bacterium]|nr:class I SAM-dependent methyltransferase [Cyanobacteriota bacterium]